MTRERLAALLESLHTVRAGVIGDFCLDAYWELDERSREASLETGKITHSVRRQRYAPGGAGNVAWNLAALGAGGVTCFGVIAPDMFGEQLRGLLHQRAIDTHGLVIQPADWDTPVYAKPYLGAEEQERIDFGRWNSIARGAEREVIRRLREEVSGLHAVIVNQQLVSGIWSPAVIEGINAIVREHPEKVFLLDARTMINEFSPMVLKLSTAQAAEAWKEQKAPVFVTRNVEGILLYEGKRSTPIPAVQVNGPTDPVGAGDTTVAAIALGLAAGATPLEAGELATLAAAVTVQKLRQTGTASAEEILRIFDS